MKAEIITIGTEILLGQTLDTNSAFLGSSLAGIGIDVHRIISIADSPEAIENALKLASFYNKKSRVIAFKNSFHGRTSAAVAVTDNPKIISPLNAQQKVSFIKFNNIDELEFELKKGDVSSIIFESIQGVGGLDQPEEKFIKEMCLLSK